MTEFGSYEILEIVARGSTGTVYRARHREIGRLAAIKELSPQLRAVPGLVQRFRSEAHTLASLDDEHVVAVYDFVEEGDRVWIAEEWVDGVTIAALLTAHGRLTAEQSLGVLRGALLGLAHAHDRNLVHRDFAPANILADHAGTSKLVDFGLAAPIGGTGACGTPAFMSPEAARGGPVGKSSDVYSAAAVLFSLLSGRMAFPSRTADEVMRAHIEQLAPALVGHGPAMADLVAQAMSKEQAARPPDARTFLARLEDAARQRYGADWLKRASIAGLVTAVAGTGAAAGSTVGATVASDAAAATVFIDAHATTGGVATTARRASRFSRKWMIGAGVIAAAGIAIPIAAGAVSFTKGDGGGKNNAASAAPLATTSSTASPTTVAQLVPQGVYLATVTITSTNIPGSKAGAKSTSTWILDTSCTATVCTGTASSSSGDEMKAKFDGAAFTVNRSDQFEAPCVEVAGPNKGKQVPGTLARARTTTVGTARIAEQSSGPVPAAGVPLLLSGSGTTKVVYKVLKPGSANRPCKNIPTETERFTISLQWQR